MQNILDRTVANIAHIQSGLTFWKAFLNYKGSMNHGFLQKTNCVYLETSVAYLSVEQSLRPSTLSVFFCVTARVKQTRIVLFLR